MKESQQPERSHDVFREVLIDGDDVKLSQLLCQSAQLVRNWCHEPQSRKELTRGRYSPLENIRTLILMVEENDGAANRAYPIGDYVARLLGGVFAPIIQPSISPDFDMLARLSAVMEKTAEAVKSSSHLNIEGISNSKAKEKCIRDIDQAIVSLIQLKMHVCPHWR